MASSKKEQEHTSRPSLFESPEFPPHLLGSAQLSALSAICDTLLPSISLDEGQTDDVNENVPLAPANSGSGQANVGRQDKGSTYGTFKRPMTSAEKEWFELSGAEGGLPDKAACLMQARLKPDAMEQLSLVLWLLSTTIGTILLGGRSAFVASFPFARPFAKLPLWNREAILKAWAFSSLLAIRTIFKVFKSFLAAVAFTEVNEKGWNPLWDAIGYAGPDPKMMAARKARVEQEAEGRFVEVKPLSQAVVELPPMAGSVDEALSKAGCRVLPVLGKCGAAIRSLKGIKQNELTVVKCDAVVVGSGSGGGVVAALLAKAGLRVLVLEKGNYFARSDLSLLEGPSMSAMYDGGGLLATEDGAVSLLAASVVGGGSTVNWAASFRTPEHVRREWADEYGLKRYQEPEFDEALDAVCERLGVHDTCTEHSFMNSVLWNGCQKLGYPVSTIPRNAPGAHSCNWCGLGCWNGAKQSTAETWLIDAATLGAKILTGCHVERVLMEPTGKQLANGRSRKARGVLARLGEGGTQCTHLVVEAPTVVVAGGSIQTPAILLRSGLKNPNIGRTLRIHPVTAVCAYFPEGRGPKGRSFEGGIMTACSTVVANWESSGYGALLQTPWVHPGIASSVTTWKNGAQYKEQCLWFARTAAIIVITRDRGYGCVKVDAKGVPRVHYSLGREDNKHMMDGVEHALRILRAAGAQFVVTAANEDEPFYCDKTSEKEFEAYLQMVRKRGIHPNSTALFSAHQTGSCRMGTDPKTSAIDSRAESWEVEGLYLGDGSVLPTPPGVNPMITIQSVAYCIGKGLASELKTDCDR